MSWFQISFFQFNFETIQQSKWGKMIGALSLQEVVSLHEAGNFSGKKSSKALLSGLIFGVLSDALHLFFYYVSKSWVATEFGLSWSLCPCCYLS